MYSQIQILKVYLYEYVGFAQNLAIIYTITDEFIFTSLNVDMM